MSEGYDGMYDPAIGYMLHSYKETYLYWAGASYKEYGATQISESEFMNFANAAEIKEAAVRAAESMGNGTEELSFSYFVRPNGILHIQCDRTSPEGYIYYGYFTLEYKGDTIKGEIVPEYGFGNEIGKYTDGQMQPFFSNLEVTY